MVNQLTARRQVNDTSPLPQLQEQTPHTDTPVEDLAHRILAAAGNLPSDQVATITRNIEVITSTSEKEKSSFNAFVELFQELRSFFTDIQENASASPWITNQLREKAYTFNPKAFKANYHSLTAYMLQGEFGNKPADFQEPLNREAESVYNLWEKLKNTPQEIAKKRVVEDTPKFLDTYRVFIHAVAAYGGKDFDRILFEIKEKHSLFD